MASLFFLTIGKVLKQPFLEENTEGSSFVIKEDPSVFYTIFRNWIRDCIECFIF